MSDRPVISGGGSSAIIRSRVLHPCQMPESLLARIIRASTNPESLIIDPFAGSGTTLAAAKKLGRKYLGIELSGSFADHIAKRLADIPDFNPPTGAVVRWNRRHLDELNSLYLETGVALDRLLHDEYLRNLFREQFHVRIEHTREYDVDEIMDTLRYLRKTGKLSKTFVLDDGKSYRRHKPQGPVATLFS